MERIIWGLIAATGVIDCALFAAQGMSVVIAWPAIAFILALAGMSLLIRRRVPQAARLVGGFAQVFAFAQVGGYLTYGAMSISPFPLADATLARADMALGFDWLAWFSWVNSHPWFHILLAKAYASVPIQILVLLVYFAAIDRERVDEFLLAGIMSVALIVPIMILLPAIGAWSQHTTSLVEPWRAEILMLRAHEMLVVDKTQGIVAFPSFHTVLGVLLANIVRGRRWLIPVQLLNVVMIASVMTEGAHYAADMLAGLVVAVVSIAGARSVIAGAGRGELSVANRAADVPAAAGIPFSRQLRGTVLLRALRWPYGEILVGRCAARRVAK